MPVFLATAAISPTCLNWEKKTSSCTSVMSMRTPWSVILVCLVPMYSVWSCTGFLVNALSANFFTSSTFASRMSLMAFDLLAEIWFGGALQSLLHGGVPADTSESACYHISHQQGNSLQWYGLKGRWDGNKFVPFCKGCILFLKVLILSGCLFLGLVCSTWQKSWWRWSSLLCMGAFLSWPCLLTLNDNKNPVKS